MASGALAGKAAPGRALWCRPWKSLSEEVEGLVAATLMWNVRVSV